MDILLRYLDSDTTGIICEFLINGDDYTPFTLENIRQLEPRIHNWPHCMQWAARVGDMLILKYVGQKKKITGIDWERCAEDAAAHGNLDGFKYCAYRAFYYGWAAWQIGVFCAIKNGHVHIVRYASNHFSIRNWKEFLLNSALCGNVELVKYFETKCFQSKTEHLRKNDWEECLWIAKKKGHIEITNYSQKKIEQHRFAEPGAFGDP